MRRPPRHLRIFVSSPGDLHEERAALPEVLDRLARSAAWKDKYTFSVLSWDDPHAPVPMDAHLSPQQAVDVGLGLPSESDLVVVMLWSRMGTPMDQPRRNDGTPFLSGTEYEFEQARSKADGPPILLYRRLDEPVAPQDETQRSALDDFFVRLGSTALTRYRGAPSFADRVRSDIEAFLRRWEEGSPDGPPLEVQLFQPLPATRLSFRARGVTLRGRAAEWQALQAYVDAEGGFLWWAVAGDGGMGKSRIALELALSLPQRQEVGGSGRWRAGFLPRAHDFQRWHEWRPDRPTLIVIDYADARSDEVHALLVAAARQSEHYRSPLRVLLLGRDGAADAKWLQEVIGSGSEALTLCAAQHAPPLLLTPLGDDALAALVRAEIAALREPDTDPLDAAQPDAEPSGVDTVSDADIVAKVLEADAKRRPLFALLVAQALAASRPSRSWTRSELLDDWLKRERRHYWQPAGVTERDEHLLALATMVERGLSLKTFGTLDLGGLLPSARPGPDRFDAQRIQAMNGRPAHDVVWPLVPDIVGEYFVLQLLAPRDGLDDRAIRLWQTACGLAPVNAFNFVEKCLDDHPGHPTLRHIGSPLARNETERAASDFHFFWRNKQILEQFGPEGVMDYFGRMLEIERVDQGMLTLTATDLATSLAQRGHFAEARRVHESMLALEGTGGDDDVGRWYEASKRAYNLLTVHCLTGQVEEGLPYLRSLHAWAAEEPSSMPVQKQACAASANVIFVLANAGETSRAIDELTWLCTHLAQHPGVGESRELPRISPVPREPADGGSGQAARAGTAADPGQAGHVSESGSESGDEPEAEPADSADPIGYALRGARAAAIAPLRSGIDEPGQQVLALLSDLVQRRPEDARLLAGWRSLACEMAANYVYRREEPAAALSLLTVWLEAQPAHADAMADLLLGMPFVGYAVEAAAPHATAAAGRLLGTALRVLERHASSRSGVPEPAADPGQATALLPLYKGLCELARERARHMLDDLSGHDPWPEADALLDAAAGLLHGMSPMGDGNGDGDSEIHERLGRAHWMVLATGFEPVAEAVEAQVRHLELACSRLRREGSAPERERLPVGICLWAYELLRVADLMDDAELAERVVACTGTALRTPEALDTLASVYNGFSRSQFQALLERRAARRF